ncbi:MAG: response regulator [Candidatus Auribacterota bacterium]|nr:response regulator [Candidatus Auribacterota bacterium]
MREERKMEGKRKILVVDDMEENIALLQRILTETGFQVLEACNGKEAIDIVRSERPDMVLLDVMMPELDGFRTCEKLREDIRNDFMYIIMLTINDALGDVCRALNAGADDYYFKNESKKKLLRRIKYLLSRQRSTDHLSPGLLY